MTYPLHLDLRDRRVLVVGAGTVATRRVLALLEASASIVVVAPTASPEICSLAADGRILWLERAFEPGDVAGAWLVHAATDRTEVNELIVAEARRREVWSVRADDAQASDAVTPAVGRQADITFSISTGDPGRSTALRNAVLGRLADGSLAARRSRTPEHGSVVLIGGGPGDPDLITVRGRRELMDADVVVYDRLSPISLLDELADDVEIIDAGKSPSRHELSQDEINQVIVDRARSGKRVVRLKGGDPFVLGRGSEEVLACAAAGVAVQVIPGISSAIAAPAAAGIPVTHRGVSTGFIVMSGHVIDDVQAIASTGLTVVVLMGVATLPRLVEGFRSAGRSASTPVAVIHQAFGPAQTIVSGTLASIASQVRESGVSNPSVIVIGDVVSVIPAIAPDAIELTGLAS